MKPIIGYRLWDLIEFTKDEKMILTSYTSESQWIPGKIMEADKLPNFIPTISGYGDKKCHGIHAFKNINDALHYIQLSEVPTILGTVYLWGTIIEHEKGYRAQFAYPCSLEFLIDTRTAYYDAERKKLIENSLRNVYGCDVSDFTHTGIRVYEDGTKVGFENGSVYYSKLIHHYDPTTKMHKYNTLYFKDGVQFTI